VYNTAPYFSPRTLTTLADQTINLNSTSRYYLPPVRDDEGHPVSLILDSIPAALVSFTQYDDDNQFLEFYPRAWGDLDEYTVSVRLSDGNMRSQGYTFKVKVINRPPFFIEKMDKIYKVPFGERSIIKIPMIVDLEYNDIQLNSFEKPRFVSIDSTFSNMTVVPKDPATDLGYFKIRGKFSDSKLET